MASDRPSKAQRLQELQDEFTAQVPHRIKEISDALSVDIAASASTSDPEGLLRRRVHNLAGSAGTFGFMSLGQAAKDFELDLLNLPPSPGRVEKLRSHLTQLHRIAGLGPTKEAALGLEPLEPIEPGVELIYLLEDDELMAKETVQQLESFGYSVMSYPSAESLHKAYREARPNALIADIMFPEGALEGTRVAADLLGEFPDTPPVVFVSSRDDWEARLAAVRSGGRAYFSKPVDYPSMVEQLDRLTGRRTEAPLRILLLDDEPMLARYLSCVLEAAGMQTEVVTDPSLLLKALNDFSPDLLLMDIYMPACSGIEAARLIRQNPVFTNLPIVFLSGEVSRDVQLEALREGGDDFLVKPIQESHLVAAVQFRARRFRTLSLLMHQDSLTGLLNHIHLKLTLEREIALAARRGSILSVAMIDIDHFKQVNDLYGHPAGDRVIKSLSRLLLQRLRKGDVPARYGGEEFAVIFPDTTPETARVVMDQLRHSFQRIQHRSSEREFTVTFSAGVAGFPQLGDMESLLKAADQALYVAKQEGRNQVGLYR